MTQKPIFVTTHPRACSTAFERVFMTQRDTLACIHEPFGDAWYFGPERLSERYQGDEKKRQDSGFSGLTFKAVFDGLDRAASEGKRLLIKDMAYCLCPPKGLSSSIAPSLSRIERGVSTNRASAENQKISNGTTNRNSIPCNSHVEPENPTVISEAILKTFHFTFLIRHPRSSIPSYYRCCVPPLAETTGFHFLDPSEAGYAELRRFFDYLRNSGQIGPKVAGQSKTSGTTEVEGKQSGEVDICVVDADDLLDNPNGIIEAYCKSVGLRYDPGMLRWDEEDQQHAREVFAKWNGFHDDAIRSSALKPRLHKKKPKSNQEEDAEWCEKYGEQGAKIIRETVNANLDDYEYLKKFALQV